MSTIRVNASTSVVLIDSIITPNAVVLLPALNPGRTVTIRDTGNLVPPNQILVSTTGIRFADGTSSVAITAPFGYLSVTSRGSDWILTNSFGFPQNESIASVSSLTTGSIVTSTISAFDMSATYLTVDTATVGGLICGPASFSTLALGAPLVPGTTLTVAGSLQSGSASLGAVTTGPLVASSVSTGAIVGTSLSLSGDLIAGNIQAGNATLAAITATTGSFSGRISAGSLSASTILANTIQTDQFTGSRLSVSDQIQLGNMTITPSANTIVFSDNLQIPIIGVNFVTANTVQTNNLFVNESFEAPTLTSMVLGSTAIANANGSLTISSITANSVQTGSIVASSLSTGPLTTSRITVNGPFANNSYMTMNSIQTSTLSTQTFYGGTVIADTFAVGSISVENLDVAGTLTASTITSLYIPNAAVTTSSIVTGSIKADTIEAQTLSLSSGIISSTGLTIDASTSFLSISTGRLTASTLVAGTLTAENITLGAPINSSLRGPYFVCTGSTNCVVSGGPGDYYSPFFLSNVKPPGYAPNVPYTVSATFQYIIPGGYLPGNLVKFQNSLFWGGELNTDSFVYSLGGAYTTISMYGYYAENQTSNATAIIQETDLTSNSFQWSATMINDSATTLTMQTQSNANYSLIDPNVYINMQNGVLKWDYALNTTTIQNSLNDISTRNLLYYGSLSYISDPKLKRAIEPANLKRCYDIIEAIPLHRYEFIDSYVSTFKVTDKRRLGIMADEYEQFFPKSVTLQPSPVPGLSTIKTVDTQQLDMAHLGATQYLLKEIAELKAIVQSKLI